MLKKINHVIKNDIILYSLNCNETVRVISFFVDVLIRITDHLPQTCAVRRISITNFIGPGVFLCKLINCVCMNQWP